jgi:hypothetical protein
MEPLKDLMDRIEAQALVWMKTSEREVVKYVGWWQPSLNGSELLQSALWLKNKFLCVEIFFLVSVGTTSEKRMKLPTIFGKLVNKGGHCQKR